jgi:hypothetical protein
LESDDAGREGWVAKVLECAGGSLVKRDDCGTRENGSGWIGAAEYKIERVNGEPGYDPEKDKGQKPIFFRFQPARQLHRP